MSKNLIFFSFAIEYLLSIWILKYSDKLFGNSSMYLKNYWSLKSSFKGEAFHRSLLTKKKSTLPIFLTKWRVYYLKTGKIKNSSLTWYSFPVWKISDISITKILREIKFVDSNLSILTFLKLFTWWRLKFTKSTNFRPRITKNSSLRASTFSKSWFHVKSKWQKNPKISTLW